MSALTYLIIMTVVSADAPTLEPTAPDLPPGWHTLRFDPTTAHRRSWSIPFERSWGQHNVKWTREGKNTILTVLYPKGTSSPTFARSGDCLDPIGRVTSSTRLGGAQFYAFPTIGGQEVMRLSYQFRLARNFDFVRGLMIPGMFGGEVHSDGQQPNGKNGFSTRYILTRRHDIPLERGLLPEGVGFANTPEAIPLPIPAPEDTDNQPADQDVGVGATVSLPTFRLACAPDMGFEGSRIQAYLPFNTERHGTRFPFKWPSDRFEFENGKWYRLTQEVILNTPAVMADGKVTKPAIANGVIRAWVDDQLVVDRKDIFFRSVPTLTIDGLYFSTFSPVKLEIGLHQSTHMLISETSQSVFHLAPHFQPAVDIY